MPSTSATCWRWSSSCATRRWPTRARRASRRSTKRPSQIGMKRLFAVAEAYPQLKADAHFLALQAGTGQLRRPHRGRPAVLQCQRPRDEPNVRQSSRRISLAGMFGFERTTYFELSKRSGTRRAARRTKQCASNRRAWERPHGKMADWRVCECRRGARRAAGDGGRAGRADDSSACAEARVANAASGRPRFGRAGGTRHWKSTCVFAGFDGESYADIPTVRRTVGLVPPATRAARTAELKAIADFAQRAGRRGGRPASGLRAARDGRSRISTAHRGTTRDVCDHCARDRASRCIWKRARSRSTCCCSFWTTWAGRTCSSTSTRPT